jgi:aminopeptidase N
MWKRTLLFCTLVVLTLSSFSQFAEDNSNCIEKCSHPGFAARPNQVLYFQYPSMDKYDVKYLKLDIAVEANNRNIAGSALTRALVLQPMDSFICELKNNMTVDSVFINGVKIPGFTRSNDHVFVPLSPAIPAGNTITALFYYRGLASSGGVFAGTVTSNGLVYTASLSESYQGREWFPVKQILSDKIDSADIWITTDAANLAGSNGLLQTVVDKPGNKKQFQWKTRYLMDYYLASFAVGNYLEYKNYAKPASIAPDSILIQHYIVNNNSFFNSNKENLDKTPAFIEKLSELYGLYPFRNEKYGHSHANIGGGMEHQTMTTLSSFGATLIAHELGHQWFGDNVTCARWNDIWINEGFASYSEYLLIEKLPNLFPGNTPATYMQSIHTNVMSVANGSVFVPDASLFDENRIFSTRLSYNKGSAIIHNLRFEMQDDNKFLQTLQTFQQQFKGSVATAEDFKTVAQTISGKNLTDFFNQWYYGEGYPTFNVDCSKQGDSIVLLVNQTVSAPSVTPFFKGLYEFTISSLQGDTTVKVNMTANNQVFKFRSERIPTGLTVDPNNWVINKTGSIITGVNDPVNVSTDVKLFPNPGNGIIYLQYPANWFTHLSIYDVNGRLLKQSSISNGSVSQTIDSGLTSGFYFIRLNGKGKVATKKLIVNR